LKTICFICGAPRTGTTFLCNILRGHPNIAVFNGESKIWVYWKKYGFDFFKRDYLYTPEIQMLVDSETQSQMVNYQNKLYGAHETLPKCDFDWDKARAMWPPKNVFDLYLMLIHACGLEDKDVVVIKSPLVNEVGAMDLDYPNVKFIHMSRNYKTRYISAKMRSAGADRIIFGHHGMDFPTIHASLTMVSEKLRLLNTQIIGGDRYLSITYEDLVSYFYSPDKKLSFVSDFLGIDYNESMKVSDQMAMSSLQVPHVDVRLADYERYTSVSERMINDILNTSNTVFSIENSLVIYDGEDPGKYKENREALYENLRGSSEVVKMRMFCRIMDMYKSGIDIQD